MEQRQNVSRGPGWPSFQIGTASYNQAQQNLQSVQAHPSHSIEGYLSACEIVEIACSKVLSAGNLTSLIRKQALQAAYEELEALPPGESNVEKAQYIIRGFHNMTKMVAPIYSLPSEILARIFSNSICHCAHEFEPTVPPIASPVILSAVCRQWRKIAFGDRSLWTHIDLVADDGNDVNKFYPPQSWLMHSQGLPLHIRLIQCRLLDIDCLRNDTYYLDEYTSKRNTSTLLDFLWPLLPRVHSLDLVFRRSEKYLFDRLLDLWISRGIPGQAMLLSAKLQLPDDFINFRSSDHNWFQSDSSQRFNQFFRSLKSLSLRYCAPSWSDLTLENLVVLELEPGGQWSPTKAALASILTSCPRLKYLMLDDIHFNNVSGPAPSPVSLMELRTLTLGDELFVETVKFLLTLIQPGPTPLHLRVFTGDNPPTTLTAIFSFLDRWNVTTLHLRCQEYFPCFATIVGPLSRIETLIVERCYFSQTANPTDPVLNPLPMNAEQLPWPQVKNLYLRRCVLEKNHLCSLVALHSIQKVYMWRCFEARKAINESTIGIETSRAYVRSLLELVLDVAYFEDEASFWSLLSS